MSDMTDGAELGRPEAPTYEAISVIANADGIAILPAEWDDDEDGL